MNEFYTYEFYAYVVIGYSNIDWRNSVTLDELLETVSPEVKQAIEDICDRAGTWDAEWSVLKAAGELLANERVNFCRLLLGLDRQKND